MRCAFSTCSHWSAFVGANTVSLFLKDSPASLNHFSENKGRFTPKGLWWYSEWSPTRYSANVAFLCFLISEYTYDPVPENFARQQAEYFLGSSGRSYVIGYGEKWPQTPHHRASSCPLPPEECGEKWAKMSLNKKPNVHTLYVSIIK